MIDRIKAFRESATVVAIVVVLVGIAVTSGRIATDLHTYPLGQVLRGVSGLYGLVDALVLTVLTLACVLIGPQTRHAPQLTLAASLLLWLGAVVGLVFLVVSLLAAGEGSWSRFLESVGGLTDIALRGLMGYVLILAQRVATTPVATPAPTPTLAPSGTPAPEAPREDSSRRPTWQPDEATGVVWQSAADAASGAAAGTYQWTGGTWAVPSSEATELPPVRQPSADQPSGPRIVGRDDAAPAPRSGPPVWDPAADVTRRDREPETGREDPYS
jgi:hypothetical protein